MVSWKCWQRPNVPNDKQNLLLLSSQPIQLMTRSACVLIAGTQRNFFTSPVNVGYSSLLVFHQPRGPSSLSSGSIAVAKRKKSVSMILATLLVKSSEIISFILAMYSVAVILLQHLLLCSALDLPPSTETLLPPYGKPWGILWYKTKRTQHILTNLEFNLITPFQLIVDNRVKPINRNL